MAIIMTSVQGNQGNDVLLGSADADRILGGPGNDLLWGNRGADWLAGGSGDDSLFGGTGADYLIGDTDSLSAFAGGNDRLSGDEGPDSLLGGGGRDLLYGGSGADLFLFLSPQDSLATSQRDTIGDFSRDEGDRIDLSAIDANASTGGDQEFRFLGTGAFTSTAGQLRYDSDGRRMILEGDTNGDARPDFQVEVVTVNLRGLLSNDFLL